MDDEENTDVNCAWVNEEENLWAYFYTDGEDEEE